MLKKAIEDWIKDQIHIPTDFNSAYELFTKKTGIRVSKTHFHNIFANNTRIQVIKTGGVYTRKNELIDTIVRRSFCGVHMNNVIAIDEKPIIISNLKQKKIRVSTFSKRQIASNKIRSYHFLEPLSNLYLICAITCNMVLLYHLSTEPINTTKFNAFLHKVCSTIRDNKNLIYLLIDNASFHSVNESIETIMKEKKFAFTHTPPMGCFCNPIEEFFAYFDFILKNKIKSFLNTSLEPLTQNGFIDLIHQSIRKAANMNLHQIFRRAGLLEE